MEIAKTGFLGGKIVQGWVGHAKLWEWGWAGDKPSFWWWRDISIYIYINIYVIL